MRSKLKNPNQHFISHSFKKKVLPLSDRKGRFFTEESNSLKRQANISLGLKSHLENPKKTKEQQRIKMKKTIEAIYSKKDLLGVQLTIKKKLAPKAPFDNYLNDQIVGKMLKKRKSSEISKTTLKKLRLEKPREASWWKISSKYYTNLSSSSNLRFERLLERKLRKKSTSLKKRLKKDLRQKKGKAPSQKKKFENFKQKKENLNFKNFKSNKAVFNKRKNCLKSKSSRFNYLLNPSKIFKNLEISQKIQKVDRMPPRNLKNFLKTKNKTLEHVSGENRSWKSHSQKRRKKLNSSLIEKKPHHRLNFKEKKDYPKKSKKSQKPLVIRAKPTKNRISSIKSLIGFEIASSLAGSGLEPKRISQRKKIVQLVKKKKIPYKKTNRRNTSDYIRPRKKNQSFRNFIPKNPNHSLTSDLRLKYSTLLAKPSKKASSEFLDDFELNENSQTSVRRDIDILEAHRCSEISIKPFGEAEKLSETYSGSCESDGALNLFYDMIEAEKEYHPDAQRMAEGHPEIKWKMRAVLLNWIFEVCSDFQLTRNTAFYTINIIDSYLQRGPSVPKNNFQLLGMSCLLIASKLEEVDPPSISDIAYLGMDSFTEEQIATLEILVSMVNFL